MMFNRQGCWIAAVTLTAVLLVLVVECQGACQDQIDNCLDYDHTVCQAYKKWAKRDCPKTCGLCAPPPTPKPVPRCSADWNYYSGDGTCLRAIGFGGGFGQLSRNTWFECKRQCIKLGGNLVIIKDATKNGFVKNMIPDGATVWIGLKNVAADANDFTFMHVDGSYLGSYQPWDAGNPDNKRNWERCVAMDQVTKAGSWNDFPCTYNRAFVCQKAAS